MLTFIFFIFALILSVFSIKDSFNFFISPIFNLNNISELDSIGLLIFILFFKIQIKPFSSYENNNIEKYSARDIAIYCLIIILYYALVHIIHFLKS
jgi:hypothetical protein